MAVNDLFLSILKSENESAVVPFLKNLSKEDKASFSKHLMELNDQRRGALWVGGHNGKGATEKQRAILSKVAFACLSSRDFAASGAFWTMKFEEVDEILEWYRPKWFENFVTGRNNPLDFRRDAYEWVVRLLEQGHLKSARDLIVRVLPSAPVAYKSSRQYEIDYALLLRKPITLSEHIWYLFEQQSNFGGDAWAEIILKLVNDSKIDRLRVLKSTLLALTLNFNKNSVGWFVDLFEKLAPTDEELLSLQNELISALSSKHSKAVGMSLDLSKRLADSPDFRVDNVLDSLPILLSSETKSVVTKAISFCEKVLKNDPKRGDKLTIALCDAFILADDTIQTRVSKLILKYAEPTSNDLKEAIARFNGSILVGAKKVLGELIDDKASGIPDVHSTDIKEPQSYEEIKLPDDFESLLFLASQAFDGNNINDIDILPAALIKLNDQVDKDNVDKFAPAFQRALRLNDTVYSTNTGFFDHMLSAFFLDYCIHLIEKFPDEAVSLTKQWLEHKNKADEFARQHPRIGLRVFHLLPWKTSATSNTIFQPFKMILVLALNKIKAGDKLPLLSTPTHEPGYVSQRVLVERLLAYKKANVLPENIDLQIAIARSIDNSFEPADHLLLSKLPDSELKEILEFHFFDKLSPRQKFLEKEVWMTTAASKSTELLEKVRSEINDVPAAFFTGQFKWNVENVHTKIKQYNHDKKKVEDVDHTYKTLTVHFDKEQTKDKGIFRGLLSRFLTTDKVPMCLYEHFVLTKHDFVTLAVDIERALMLAPSHVEPMLAQVMARTFGEKGASEAWESAVNQKVLRRLTLLRNKFRGTGHLFSALSLTSSDKTVQSFAAELWRKNALNGNLESEQLGVIIGQLLNETYVPLKRFTDLVSSNMANVSAQHNAELQKLMNEILVRLPGEPPIGLKKLLELYLELISANKSRPIEKVITHLKIWDSSSGLKKVLASIRELA